MYAIGQCESVDVSFTFILYRFKSFFGFGVGVVLDFAASFSRFNCPFDFGGSMGVAIGSCESIGAVEAVEAVGAVDAASSGTVSTISANTPTRVGSCFFLFGFFFNFGGVVVAVAA